MLFLIIKVQRDLLEKVFDKSFHGEEEDSVLKIYICPTILSILRAQVSVYLLFSVMRFHIVHPGHFVAHVTFHCQGNHHRMVILSTWERCV